MVERKKGFELTFFISGFILLSYPVLWIFLFSHSSHENHRQKREVECANGGKWLPDYKICICNYSWTGPRCRRWKHQQCYFGDGSAYRGQLNYDYFGTRCLPWSAYRNNEFYKVGNNGVGDHNYCRNPDNDAGGLWCYSTNVQEFVIFCNATICPDSYKTIPNITDLFPKTITKKKDDKQATVNVLFGPLIGGICGGIVLLLLVFGLLHYLRKQRRFKKKKKKRPKPSKDIPNAGGDETGNSSYNNTHLAQGNFRPLGGVVTVNLDIAEEEEHTHQLEGVGNAGYIDHPESSVPHPDRLSIDSEDKICLFNTQPSATQEQVSEMMPTCAAKAVQKKPVPKPRHGRSSRKKEDQENRSCDGQVKDDRTAAWVQRICTQDASPSSHADEILLTPKSKTQKPKVTTCSQNRKEKDSGAALPTCHPPVETEESSSSHTEERRSSKYHPPPSSPKHASKGRKESRSRCPTQSRRSMNLRNEPGVHIEYV
ncbi:uncharacterized protein LOC143449696 [Clavelina lepadiformis]|uniref:uncharacterized protein LOC143449696 n=1 Tax=Clavelina lepadiformis TaxID=159417 RepID=UPI00404113EF